MRLNLAPIKIISRQWLAILALLPLLLSACAGIGLSGEPEIVATIPRPTPRPAGFDSPLTPPNLAEGREIFIANCTRCHGVNGAGDGAFALSGDLQDNDPGNFNDDTATAGDSPFDYFNIITRGNMRNLMPPWQDALTDEQRWAVAMYTFMLAYTGDELALGEQVVAQNQVVDSTLDTLINRPDQMSNLSDGALRSTIREANRDLSAEEIRAAMVYARARMITGFDELQIDNTADFTALNGESAETADADSAETVDNADDAEQEQEQVQEPVATEEAEAPVTDAEQDEVPAANVPQGDVLIGTIQGAITNLSADGTVPDALPITVEVITETSRETFTATSNAGGTYTVPDVPIIDDSFYVVSADYRDRRFYSSTPAVVDGETTTLDYPIEIYELTEDPNAISIVAEVMQINPVGNTLEVLHIYRFRNDSDRAFTTSNEIEPGVFSTLEISLPVDAVIIGFDTNGRYLVLDDEDGFIDTQMVLPGDEHFISVTYLLAYDNDAIIDYPVSYAMQGPSRVLLGSGEMSLEGDNYILAGEQTFEGRIYREYATQYNINPGDSIRFEVSGGGTSSQSGLGDSGVITEESLLPLIGVFVIVTLVVALGLYIYQQRRGDILVTEPAPAPVRASRAKVEADSSAPVDTSDAAIDALLAQITALEKQHENGQINHDLYHQKRKQLKAALAALMGTDETD